MAVYRKQRRINPVVVGLAVVAVGALILAGVLLIRARSRSASDDPLAGARAKAQEAAQGLDVFTIEYPQAGEGAERAGALGALSRAQSAFEAAQNDLARINPTAVARVAADFGTLQAKAKAGAPVDEVVSLAEETRATLLALATQGSGAPNAR